MTFEGKTDVQCMYEILQCESTLIQLHHIMLKQNSHSVGTKLEGPIAVACLHTLKKEDLLLNVFRNKTLPCDRQLCPNK